MRIENSSIMLNSRHAKTEQTNIRESLTGVKREERSGEKKVLLKSTGCR